MTSLFPMFLKLAGRTCLVVGAGSVGEQKIAGLIDTGARIRVVAFEATEAVHRWAAEGKIELALRAFAADDLNDAFLAVVATQTSELNTRIYREAERRRILCNVVDVPELCDFYYPAVVKRGDLQIAISTAGQSPALAQRIRQRLERQFSAEYAEWVAELGVTRRLVLASNLSRDHKLHLLHSLAGEPAAEAPIAEERIATTKGTAA